MIGGAGESGMGDDILPEGRQSVSGMVTSWLTVSAAAAQCARGAERENMAHIKVDQEVITLDILVNLFSEWTVNKFHLSFTLHYVLS